MKSGVFYGSVFSDILTFFVVAIEIFVIREFQDEHQKTNTAFLRASLQLIVIICCNFVGLFLDYQGDNWVFFVYLAFCVNAILCLIYFITFLKCNLAAWMIALDIGIVMGTCALQRFFPQVQITGSLLLIAHTVYFAKSIVEITKGLITKSEEYVQMQKTITFSQIRPHFLYNCLNSIYYLCDNNPKLAKAAIADFSDYLRGDLDSIAGDKIVDFTTELEHTQHYLRLEKMRFTDELNIEYEIEMRDFKLPALTLQPLVENAVKHGISKKEGGGTIRISSSYNGSIVTIKVVDNGVGFDTRKDVNNENNDDRTHVGITNVETRLKCMCNGMLEIESDVGRGTCATISIPLIE